MALSTAAALQARALQRTLTDRATLQHNPTGAGQIVRATEVPCRIVPAGGWAAAPRGLATDQVLAGLRGDWIAVFAASAAPVLGETVIWQTRSYAVVDAVTLDGVALIGLEGQPDAA